MKYFLTLLFLSVVAFGQQQLPPYQQPPPDQPPLDQPPLDQPPLDQPPPDQPPPTQPTPDQTQQQPPQSMQSMQSMQGQQPQQGMQGMGQQGPEVWQLIQNNPQLSYLNSLIMQNPDLKQALTGPLTFFIPNDNSIRQFVLRNRQTGQELPQERLGDLIRAHIVYGFLPTLQPNTALATLKEGYDLKVTGAPGRLRVNDANVIGEFNQGSNFQGFYIVDQVLGKEQGQGGVDQPTTPRFGVRPAPRRPIIPAVTRQ